MYPSLEIDVDGELEKLKVSSRTLMMVHVNIQITVKFKIQSLLYCSLELEMENHYCKFESNIVKDFFLGVCR